MKSCIKSWCTGMLCLLILFHISCKDGQMDDDPLKDLLVKVTGFIEGPLPSTWYKPMVMASYPKFSRKYGTNMYGEVEGVSWYVFVEKYSEVQIYLFNDANNNNAYDWPYEPRIPAAGTVNTPLNVVDYDIPGISIPIRKVSGTLSSIPDFFKKPIVALVYPNDKGWPTLEAFSPVNSDGTFTAYGTALDNYKLWIISDTNENGVYDYAIREPYITIPERQSKSLSEDDAVIDLSSSDAIVTATLGSLIGSIKNSAGWSHPQAALYQGWDVMAYNPMGDSNFSFCMVDEYSINGSAGPDPKYYILLFDDDNPTDGIFVYDDEHDELHQGSEYSSHQDNIERTN